ncbi:MAG: dihydrofolate reductase family protein [Jatrophihabitans sp.]
MGTIAVHEFYALDGVFDTPSWTADFGFDPRMGDAIGAITGDASAILLGRTTFEMFAPAWSTRTAEDDPGAPFFNDTQKYVVSSTLQDAESTWRNSTVLGPYSADSIRELKDRVDGGVYVSGSGTLVRALLADGLVDALHLFVYPVVVGGGKKKLFPDGVDTAKFALETSETYSNGVVHLGYVPA